MHLKNPMMGIVGQCYCPIPNTSAHHHCPMPNTSVHHYSQWCIISHVWN